jgi:hypothetical protein
MNKTLGLDLGTNSIGWALIDNDDNQLLEIGVFIFPNNSFKTGAENRLGTRELPINKEKKYLDKSNLIILCLLTVSVVTGVLTLVNNSNWQYWMNLSITFLVALLTLIYSKDK